MRQRQFTQGIYLFVTEKQYTQLIILSNMRKESLSQTIRSILDEHLYADQGTETTGGNKS